VYDLVDNSSCMLTIQVCVVGVPDPEGGGHVPRAFCVILQEWVCTPEEIQDFTNCKYKSCLAMRFLFLRGFENELIFVFRKTNFQAINIYEEEFTFFQ